MSQITPALALRITAAFEQLSTAAKNLNTASDELAKSVGQLDTALRKLNLGVATSGAAAVAPKTLKEPFR